MFALLVIAFVSVPGATACGQGVEEQVQQRVEEEVQQGQEQVEEQVQQGRTQIEEQVQQQVQQQVEGEQ